MGLILLELILCLLWKDILFSSKNQSSKDVINLCVILFAEMLNAFKGYRKSHSFSLNVHTCLEQFSAVQ